MQLKNKDAALDKAIAAHQAAHAIRVQMDTDDTPDGKDYDAAGDAEDEAMLGVVNAPCSPDGQVRKLRYVYNHDKMQEGELEEILGFGDPFAPTVHAVRAFLEQRA